MKRFTTLLIITLVTTTAWSQKIYKVKYESQAGWRNKDKQHLLL